MLITGIIGRGHGDIDGCRICGMRFVHVHDNLIHNTMNLSLGDKFRRVILNFTEIYRSNNSKNSISTNADLSQICLSQLNLDYP